jgi:signal transduction histidine kinase
LGGRKVLVVEAGESLAASEQRLARARNAAVLLAGLLALGVWIFASRWVSVQALRREELARAARTEALTRLAAAAAHEIRNPLATIRATAELLGERMSGSEIDDPEAVSGIVSEVERLRRLTDDLVYLSVDRPLSSIEVDVKALAGEAAYAIRQRFPRLEVQVDSSRSSWVLGDDLRLGQVLRNLVQNAAEAKEDGRVRIILREERGVLCVRVEDEGPGVDESIRATLFEAFVTTRAQGTGLGLALSRRIVERHGGRLEHVASTSGAAFELRLPVHRKGEA